MCGEQIVEVEKSGAADMIDQIDLLNAQEETTDSDIRGTQDTKFFVVFFIMKNLGSIDSN